jgi:hypothetical protein
MGKRTYVEQKEAPVSWFSEVENGYRENEKASSKGASERQKWVRCASFE